MQSPDTQDSSTNTTPSSDTPIDNTVDRTRLLPSSKHTSAKAAWIQWYAALKSILPVYVAVHLAFFVTTCLSVLFTVKDFAWQSKPIYTLWQSWHQWDTGHYLSIALHGYDTPYRSAFFPLYPLLERGLMVLTRNPFTAGLVISNLAGLVMLVVLYRLVIEDFDQETASRTILYLSVFPTAFFLAAAYNESLFLGLSLLSFYHMRHGQWWLAGLFGFLASLTRSAGLFLLFPFCFEYLRLYDCTSWLGTRSLGRASTVDERHNQTERLFGLDVLSGALIPAGLAIFALYCYFRFHDPLSFSHAQVAWGRHLNLPGVGMLSSIRAIMISGGMLNFQVIRNILDLGPDLLVLALVILGFVGPWKFPRNLWGYAIYATALYLFLQLFPGTGNPGTGLFPLQSVSRFMLEVFPAFIVLAGIGKNRTFHLSYLMVSGAILFFLLTQFLTGHWVL